MGQVAAEIRLADSKFGHTGLQLCVIERLRTDVRIRK